MVDLVLHQEHRLTHEADTELVSLVQVTGRNTTTNGIVGRVGSSNPQGAVEDVLLNWVNQTGLGQVDPDVWTRRLDRACAEGVWEDDVARRLAAEFITEDLPYSMRDDGTTPPIGEAAQALWLMAVNYCRADFPAGEIADGTPTP